MATIIAISGVALYWAITGSISTNRPRCALLDAQARIAKLRADRTQKLS